MSDQASWLKHPRAVAQNFFVARGFDGAYKCKTNRGSLEIWHRSQKNTLSPNGMKVVHTFSGASDEEAQLIELARQDPRHAIAAHLGIDPNQLQLEEFPGSNKPGFTSTARRFGAIRQCS